MRGVILASLLNIAVWAAITLSRTYVDVLFLSSYPLSWLPFLFMGQTAAVLLITFITTPLVKQGSPRLNAILFGVSALLVLAGHFLINAELSRWLPFVFCLWLSALTVMLSVVSLNAITDAFDIRHFKQIVVRVNIAGNIGGLIMGLAIPLLTRFFTVDIILPLLGIMILLVAAGLAALKPLQGIKKKHSQSHSPLRYPLFKSIAWCAFFLMLVDVMADYALKVELGKLFDEKEAIAEFVGPMYGISSLLMLFFQFVAIRPAMQIAGVAALLTAIPVFCGAASIALMLLPGLWAAAALRLGEHALRYSLFAVGRDLGMNPLPAQIRRAGKLMLKPVGYIGAGLASILLLFSAGLLGTGSAGVLILLASAAWIWRARSIPKEYQDTLEEAIRIQRFSLDGNELMARSQNSLQDVTRKAFLDDDPEIVRFAFNMLQSVKAPALPEDALRHLDSEHADIRTAFVKAAYNLKDRQVITHLLRRLSLEKDADVIWWLLKTLSAFKVSAVVPAAVGLLNNYQPMARAGAIVVLLHEGDEATQAMARKTFFDMLGSEDPSMRAASAEVIGALEREFLNYVSAREHLRTLMRDRRRKVRIAAFSAIANHRMYDMADMLAANLVHGGNVARQARRMLAELGAPVIPTLLKVALGNRPNSAHAAVRTLATIPGDEAEAAIVHIGKKAGVLVRTWMAREAGLRAKNQDVNSLFKDSARQFVAQETATLRLLAAGQKSDKLPGSARRELSQRLKMAESRLLYWFAVSTQPDELLGVLPTLLSEETPNNKSTRAAALEFLDTLATKHPVLKSAVQALEGKAPLPSDSQALENLSRIHDDWLKQMLTYVNQPPEKIPEAYRYVTILREVGLFANLPGELLLALAKHCQSKVVRGGEALFAEGDAPNGMYMVSKGTVLIQQKGATISELQENAFFGELGLIDDEPRRAGAIAKTGGELLFLDKKSFEQLARDLPEVLRVLARTVIGYLRATG